MIDATEQARMVRDGEVSPAELVDEAIGRLEDLNPQLNAVIHPLLDEARATTPQDGPFKGVPLLVKDLSCYMKGVPVHEGMRALKEAGYRSDHDMWITRKFREAGFVILGRTNTPELGILPTTEPVAYGATRNPWDLERSTGGSSGGSAAAVAAGIVAAAHANDGGGSIRIPASHCGLVGLKPSRGRVSLAPDFGEVLGGLVIELAVTHTVRDAAGILDAIHGPAPGDPYAAPTPTRPYVDEVGGDASPPTPLKIGISTAPPGGQFEAHPECITAARDAAKLLEGLGHDVVESHPAVMDDPDLIANFLIRWTAGVDWNLKYWSAAIGREIGADDVEPCTWALAQQGRNYSAGELLRAFESAQAGTRQIASWWADDGFDLLLTPTCAEPPPRLGEFDAPPDNPAAPIMRAIPFGTFTAGFNTTGQPAISLPLHVTADGLPVGVQLAAAYGREDLLLRIAAQIEQAAPWVDRRPALAAAGA